MDFLDYMRETGRSAREVGEQVGVTKSYILHLKAGRRHPSARLMSRITEATQSMVTFADWERRRELNPTPWAAADGD
jgi:transcriptional regulator with XRE-family HTH domain